MAVEGRVAEITSTALRVRGLSSLTQLGDLVACRAGTADEIGEVIRVERETVTVKPFSARIGVPLEAPVRRIGRFAIAPGPAWKGRVVNALGEPIDDAGPLPAGVRGGADPDRRPPAALRRARVNGALKTGIRAIDIFSPLCFGQRIGIFAGSGVGKSTLLAMFAGSLAFDTVVIGLVGERGREVREFIEDSLGPNRQRAVTVVATSDESPMLRRMAATTALAIAESFRDAGERVLLILDSITRYAHALREVALSAGEPALARGYPPSVFSDLPKLLERAGPGCGSEGSITAIFSVLVDGDDHNDPVSDAIRGTLDGHIVLDRRIAAQGRYPAIDLNGSLSRLAQLAWSPEQAALVTKMRAMVARYEDSRDLRAMGAYLAGSDLDLDQAVALVPRIYAALTQSPASGLTDDAFRELANLLQRPK